VHGTAAPQEGPGLVEQANKDGAVVGCCTWLASSFAAANALLTAVTAFCAGVVAAAHVVQVGATAARAPSRAACVIVPYMRKACPNQKIPITIMKSKGKITAVSAISEPRVFRDKTRHIVDPGFFMFIFITIAPPTSSRC
jgi:hypothetical protein